MCPGIHLAERNMWLAFAKLLWAFEFRGENGPEGIETDVGKAYSEGFLVCAREWGLKVKVRGEERRGTVEREFERAKTEIFANYPD